MSKVFELLEQYYQKKPLKIEYILDLIENSGVSAKHEVVLKELLKIEERRLLSYTDFAKKCCFDNQIRNVSTLIGKNPYPVIIPCHRVIKKDGKYGDYIFGSEIKKELIEFDLKNIDLSNKTKNIIQNYYENLWKILK